MLRRCPDAPTLLTPPTSRPPAILDGRRPFNQVLPCPAPVASIEPLDGPNVQTASRPAVQPSRPSKGWTSRRLNCAQSSPQSIQALKRSEVQPSWP